MDDIGPPPDCSEFGCLEDELKARRDFMVSSGYRACSIMACNCNSWHGGNASNRVREIVDLLYDYGARKNGVILLDNLKSVLEQAGYSDD